MRVDIITSIAVVIVKFNPSNLHKIWEKLQDKKSLQCTLYRHSSSSNESKFHYFTKKEKVGVFEFKREKLT